MPGMRDSFGRSSSMTWSAVSVRASRAFSSMFSRAPPPPYRDSGGSPAG